MDINVKTSISKYRFEVQSTYKKILGNKYEPKVALDDKVYPKTYYRHQLGSVVVDETIEEELRRAKRGVLYVQLLVVRSSLHSSSSLEGVKGKAYNEKMQFVQMIIQDINIIGTSAVEFLHRSEQCWCAKEHIRPGATLIDLVCIKESEEDKVEEHHFVETLIVQKDAREENVVM